MTRPSRRLTLSVSSVDCTSSTRSSLIWRRSEKLIPCLQEFFPILGHHRLYRAQFVGAKPKIARQLGWVNPELSRQVVAIDMNVRRFVGFVKTEKLDDLTRIEII